MGASIQVAIVASEPSGDRLAGQLAAEIRRLAPEAVVWGTGGKYLREAGADVVADTAHLGVIGVVAALRLLPWMLASRRRLLAELQRRRPDVLIPIDSGALHLGYGPIEGLCAWTRRMLPATRILYYFPPGSWRRRLTRTALDRLADAVATPFPWSESELRRLGVRATFVGHPLLDLVHPSGPVEAFADRLGLDRARPIVGILPGSRMQEIQEILPVELEAAALIHQRIPGAQFILPLAPTIERGEVERRVRAAQELAATFPLARRVGEATRALAEGLPAAPLPVPADGAIDADELLRRQREWIHRTREGTESRDRHFPMVLVEDATYDAMAVADVLICTSGTATLEAAILGRPMVIVYRISRASVLEYRLAQKRLPPHIGLPNLLADRRVCPELVQEAATPEAISSEIIALLLEPDRMLKMRAGLQAAVAHLGEPGAAARTAQMALEMAREATRG